MGEKISQNPIIPLLWLEAVWMIGDVESERLVGGLLAPCLDRLPHMGCLLPRSFTVCRRCSYVIDPFSTAMPQASLPLPAVQFTPKWDTWREGGGQIPAAWHKPGPFPSLVHHDGPQRTSRNYKSCFLTLIWLTRKDKFERLKVS